MNEFGELGSLSRLSFQKSSQAYFCGATQSFGREADFGYGLMNKTLVS